MTYCSHIAPLTYNMVDVDNRIVHLSSYATLHDNKLTFAEQAKKYVLCVSLLEIPNNCPLPDTLNLKPMRDGIKFLVHLNGNLN